MSKYYRVVKTNFMWEAGAILENDACDGKGYTAISDLWDKVPLKTEYITAHIIEDENNADFFERVYPIGKIERMMFGSKKQAQIAASALYKGDK